MLTDERRAVLNRALRQRLGTETIIQLEEASTMTSTDTTANETIRTATHEFYIKPCIYRLPEGVTAWQVDFQPLNKKTGKPWQASHRVTDQADVEPIGWQGRAIAYSTFTAARLAAERHIAKLAK